MKTTSMSKTRYRTGIVLLLVSAFVFSTAGLFTKGVVASAWEVIFWRGLFAAVFTTAYVAWRGSVFVEFVKMGRWGWLVAIVGASGTAAFIPAFKLTSVANVSLIYAAAPLIAALMAWIWMREKPGWPTIVGSILAFFGVALIVGGSLEQVNLKGDVLAMWMTLVIASIMVIYRRFPQIPAAGPSVFMSVLLLPFAAVLSDPFQTAPLEIGILSLFGLVFAVASVTLAEGAKRLPSGETALLSSLEAPFAILLALIVLSEFPAAMTIIGGGLIMAGVLGSQWLQLRTVTDS